MAIASERHLDNSGQGLLKVPGFNGVSLRHIEVKPYFAKGLSWMQTERLTAREIAMLRFMNTVTDKPSWHIDIFDEQIVQGWRKEALNRVLISTRAWEWCQAELRDNAVSYSKTGYVSIFETGSCMRKSDSAVSLNLHTELGNNIAALTAEMSKDWDLESGEQVMNIVDPSLFPLTYGKPLCLCMEGKLTSISV